MLASCKILMKGGEGREDLVVRGMEIPSWEVYLSTKLSFQMHPHLISPLASHLSV